MLDITYLLNPLEKTILEQQIGTRKLTPIKGILLLTDQTRLSSDFLYVGYYSVGLHLLEQSSPDQPITMFLSAEDINQTRIPDSRPHNIIVSALDAFEIHNRLHDSIQIYQNWHHSLMSARCSGKSLQESLRLAADMIQSRIYILNPGYRILAQSNGSYGTDPISQELESNGYLSFETSAQLNPRMQTIHQHNCYRKIQLHRMTYHLYYIYRNQSLLAMILLPENPQSRPLDFHYLLQSLSEIIKHGLERKIDALSKQDIFCASFISDIIDGHLTSAEEIENRVRFLPYPLKEISIFILIQFDETEISNPPYDYVIQELKMIFPNTNIAMYQNDIAILYTQDGRPQGKLNFDYDKLTALLKNHGAYCGISYYSHYPHRLRTLYLLASASIRFGRTFHRKNFPDRIFAHEDYSLYYIVELCAQQYMELHKHTNLIYLIHPSIIKIYRYDEQHGSNLGDVLYHYLLCGCNLARTARTMYMHRNTILNKLNKINEIIDIPLEDGYTQQRMLMSCLFARYYEEYLHMTIPL